MRARYLLVLLLLAGCTPSLEELASTCQTYGFVPGTVEMAQCVQAEQHAADAKADAMLESLGEYGRSRGEMYRSVQPQSVYVNRGYGW